MRECWSVFDLEAGDSRSPSLSRDLSRDVESSGSDDDDRDDVSKRIFNPLYYVVYAFSLLIFIVGLVLYIVPANGIAGRFTATGLYICGFMLVMNSDLTVTFLQLAWEVHRFRQNNAKFDENLREQAQKVRELSIAESAFKRIDAKFKGDVQRAAAEVDKLIAVSQSNSILNAKQLCRLYGDKDANGLIEFGAELEDTLELLGVVYGGLYPDFGTMMHELKKKIEAKPEYAKAGGIPILDFSELFAATLQDSLKAPPAAATNPGRAQDGRWRDGLRRASTTLPQSILPPQVRKEEWTSRRSLRVSMPPPRR